MTDDTNRGHPPDPKEDDDQSEHGGQPGSGSARVPRDAGAGEGRLIRGPWAGAAGPSRPSGSAGREPAAGVSGVQEFDLHPPDDVRYCYRHPDRETGVSCSNCGRPICWECMTPAPVGFRCPECMGRVRSERRTAPVISRAQTRDRWAGRTGAPATRALVGINVAVFILEVLFGGLGGNLLFGQVGGQVVVRGALYPILVAQNHEYWRLVTSMFLHINLLHIGFNMWALWVAGTWLEHLIGTKRFLVIYFVSGLAGSALVMLLANPLAPTLGASGAIFGVFGALFMVTLHSHDLQSSMLRGQLGFIILINLAFTFSSSGISWQAHVGGLVGGVLAMEAMLHFGRRRLGRDMDATDVAWSLLVLAGVIAVILVRIVTFPAV